MKRIYFDMKKTKTALACALLFFGSMSVFANGPTRGFNYQAIARDVNGNPIENKAIGVQLSVHQNNENGTIVWQETHSATTNEFGLFTMVIGEGVSTGAGTVQSMSDVDWTSGFYFIQVKADFGAGLIDMGTTKLQAVPYALKADSALTSPRYPISQSPDVDVTGLSADMILKWNGTKWVGSNVMMNIQSDSAYLKSLIDAQTANLNNLKTLATGKTYVGDNNNNATQVFVTGDATLATDGTLTIANNAVTSTKIADGNVTNAKLGTGIDATKLADGTISNAELQFLDGTSGNVQSQIDNMSTSVTASATDITSLKSLVTSLGATTSNLLSQVNTANNTIAVNTSDIAALSTGVASLNSTVADMQIQAGYNTTDIATLQSGLQLLISAVGNFQTQIDNNTNDVAVATLNITMIQNSLQNLNSITTDIQTQMAANTSAITDNTAAISSLQNDVQSLNTTTTDLQTTVTTMQTEADNTADALQGLSSMVNARSDMFQADIDDLGNKVSGIGNTVTDMQTQVTSNTTSINSALSSIQSLNNTTADMQSQIDLNASTLSDINSSLQTINGSLTGMQSQIAINNMNITMLETELNNLNGDASYELGTGTLTINNGAITPNKIGATGTANATTFLRGDGTWAAPTATIPNDLSVSTVTTSGTVTAPTVSVNGSNIIQSLNATSDFTLDPIDHPDAVILSVKNTGSSTITITFPDTTSVTLSAGKTMVFLKTTSYSFMVVTGYEG